MEKNPTTFATDEERLAAINRTAEEHSAHEDVDVRSIVVSAMDAYSAKRIEAAEDIKLQIEFIRQTVRMIHRSSLIFNPLRELVNDFLAVTVPALAYLPLFYLIVRQIGDWGTPLPRPFVYSIIGIPSGIAIALFLVSIPRTEYRWFPLGILKDHITFFMPRVRVGAIISGLLMTSFITWALVRDLNSKRENRAISFTSSKAILVDKSLETVKELQSSGDTTELSTKQTDIQLSPDKLISIRTQKEPQSKKVKYVVEDRGAFPGRLEADVSSKSGSVYWTHSNKTVTKSQIYVCKVKGVSADNVVVEALDNSGTTNTAKTVGSSDTSKDIDHSNTLDTSKPPDSRTSTISLILRGNTIQLTFNEDLISTDLLEKDEYVVLAYDPETSIATRIEKVSLLTAANK